MESKRLNSLCQPLKPEEYYDYPSGIGTDNPYQKWKVSLFQIERDEWIILEWEGHNSGGSDELREEYLALVTSYQDIAERGDMQAFVVWKGAVAICQIDVVKAYSPLAQVTVPFPGAHLLYIKYSHSGSLIDLSDGLKNAAEAFLGFEEVSSLYAVLGNEEEVLKGALAAAGFRNASVGSSDGRCLMALGRGVSKMTSH
ncbi:hypothetical protein [Chitinophaga rhizosphaerae]|uniref:hypothetical protein n=1 Tax=Chitinophaga rhizosphaerae TaxID=1864947 RepID=UPI000F802283|nr:hypothetical protein [Chitinophaga rhizosphaerae]